ncbi:protein of unknown function [Alteromonadaceae bacterium Bs31]|nr:protein of unknown function [Alteromonadaceae bacterium Bs31]
MNSFIAGLSTSKAAKVVGIAFISSVIIVTIVDDFLLANFVVPGDSAALARDIKSNGTLFFVAVLGYLLVLALDSIIALALYVVLSPSNKQFALLTATLRLLYAGILVIGLVALVIELVDVYGYATIKLVGYSFFSLHIFVLGYSVFRSEYIPRTLGLLLIAASFTYIVFFIDFQLPEIVEVITMLTMAIAELSLSIWLMVQNSRLPEKSIY